MRDKENAELTLDQRKESRQPLVLQLDMHDKLAHTRYIAGYLADMKAHGLHACGEPALALVVGLRMDRARSSMLSLSLGYAAACWKLDVELPLHRQPGCM